MATSFFKVCMVRIRMYFTYECYFLATISVNLCNITPPRNQYTDLVSCSEFVLALYKSLSSFFFFVFFFQPRFATFFFKPRPLMMPNEEMQSNKIRDNFLRFDLCEQCDYWVQGNVSWIVYDAVVGRHPNGGRPSRLVLRLFPVVVFL